MSDKLHLRYRDADAHLVTESYVLASGVTDAEIEDFHTDLGNILAINPARLSREHDVIEDDLTPGSEDNFGAYTEVLELTFNTSASGQKQVFLRGPSADILDVNGDLVLSTPVQVVLAWIIDHVTVDGATLTTYEAGKRVTVRAAADELVWASQQVDPATVPATEFYKEHGMDVVSRGD